MRRLVLHLGLPKTATTSLQTHMFPQLPGYLGWFHDFTFSSKALHEFVELFALGLLVDGKRVFEIDGCPVWLPALKKWVNELLASDEEIILLSFEGFSAWPSRDNIAGWPVNDVPGSLPRQGKHPIIYFLERLSELLPANVELKTILTLRNQSDWLGSLAAQMKVTETGFVQRLIRNDDAFLNYESIVNDLESLRGRKNHLTLLFENSLEHNVCKILSFSGYHQAIDLDLKPLQVRENVKKNERGWLVVRATFADRLVLHLRALSNRFKPLKTILRSENLFLQRLRSSAFRLFKRLAPMRKPVVISLSDEQRCAIKLHCKHSNARLGIHLGKDLSSLGY